MRRLCWISAAAIGLVLATTSEPRAQTREKTKLTLRAAPEVGTSSTVFVFQARLTGAKESEEFYCLISEWFWEEQADSSLNEFECPPYIPGQTKIERVFTEEQSFRRPGPHRVRLVLRKGEKEIASASVIVTVRPSR